MTNQVSNIFFVLNDNVKIRISVPPLHLKFNYYYKPIEKLYKHDEVRVTLLKDGRYLELNKDMIDEIIYTLYRRLKLAVTGLRVLPCTIAPGTAGYALNHILNETQEGDLGFLWMWCSRKKVSTLLYNANGTIYLEIVPLYKWFYSDPKPGEHYVTFDEFMKTYKPYYLEIVPLEVALAWKQQCENILEDIGMGFLLREDS